MFHNFKEGSLVRVISLPWYKYGGSKVLVGDLVTIHAVTKENYNYNYRFVILKELLEISPHHNIGMKHLKPTGLRVIPSRNKREGTYLGNTKGKVVRAIRLNDKFNVKFHRTPSQASAHYHIRYTERRYKKHKQFAQA